MADPESSEFDGLPHDAGQLREGGSYNRSSSGAIFANWLAADNNFSLAQWLFLRLLGLVYLFAFVSLAAQVKGLIGQDGILPAQSYLEQLRAYMGQSAYWLCPTLTWFSASDAFLQTLAIAGAVIALMVVCGATSTPFLALLYILYLSLTAVGRVFLQFQWDSLLLECGFLAILLAPWGWLPPGWQRWKTDGQTGPIKVVIWLERWLLFRVMFFSGLVKLSSGDESYRNLTALTYHWFTQPLPTPIAWYLAQLPLWFQKVSELAMFLAELLVPLLIFCPGRLRIVGALLIAGFQTLIALTGNYCFFNLLTAGLCLFLVDDAALSRLFLLRRLKAKFTVVDGTPGRWRTRLLSCVGCSVFLLSVSNLTPVALPILDSVARGLSPFCIANSYGVFAVMTTRRHEIVLEGSGDGKVWREYSFKYKPGGLKRELPWVAPHQPRLDWQMWFAALGSAEDNHWFGNFIYRVLQGAPEVLALLESNPFPDRPPKLVRAVIYDYHFSDWTKRKSDGDVWQRKYVGIYFPACSLDGIVEE